MNYSKVESSLSHAAKKLDEVSRRRERLIKESREVISLSARTIISVHSLEVQNARKLKKQAREKLYELKRVAGEDLSRYLATAEQEYVEASMMYSMSSQGKIPSLEELDVSPSSYLLGLLDGIGEIKRTVYDKIRSGDVPAAESAFSTMESLYLLISPFAVYDNVSQGLKRKLDVARILIEDTRSVVTEEARRAQFMVSLNKVAQGLGAPPHAVDFGRRAARQRGKIREVNEIEDGAEEE